jgi:hypothetical protein
MTGHYHSYQRSCAALHTRCVPDGKSGTVHVVVGTAGASLDTYYHAQWPKTAWSLSTYMGFGFARVKANRTNLEYVLYDNGL